MFQGEDSSPPPSPTKRRHGTVVGPLIPPDVTRTLPQFIFSSQESTNRNSYHSLGAATGNRPSDGGVRPNEGTMQGPSSRPSQGHATLSEKCVSKPNGGHLAEMHPRNGPKQNAKGAALGISPLDRPHEGKGPGAQPANGPSVTQSQIIVAPSTPTVTDMTDNDISTRDCIDLPERFRGTRFRKPVVREEIDSVSELRERERDLTTAIDWIRQEILQMKQADRNLMRKFMELGTVIHTLQDNGTFNTSSSFDSPDELLLLEDFRDVGAYLPIDKTLPNLAFKLRTMSTIVEPTSDNLALPGPRRKESAFL